MCKKFHPGKAESLFFTAGTKFSHVIASTHLSGMKKLINKSAWINPQKYILIDRSYLLYFFDTRDVSLWEKSKQMSF